MRKRNKNIYMGVDSTARLPVVGRVDSGNEILLNAIAVGYDALNNRMLTRYVGVYDKTSLREINGRFGVLRLLCNRHAPSKLTTVNRIYGIVVDYFNGKITFDQAVSILNNISIKINSNFDFYNIAAFHINQAEQIGMPKPFGIDMFLLLDNINKRNVRRR